STLDDATDAESMMETLNDDALADVVSGAGPGPDIVDDYIVRPLERTAFDEREGLEGIETRVVNAVENLQRVSHGEVLDHRGGHGHMRQGGKERSQLGRHGRAAHTIHEAGVRGAHHQV